jgi:hypothetical protein
MYPPPVRWRNHTYRDLLSSSMDVFLSTVSNRLNVVKKQLAVIATIFLPLMFITGFLARTSAGSSGTLPAGRRLSHSAWGSRSWLS